MSPDPESPSIRLVLGLGNPGEQYRWTRHNAGFLVVETLGREAGSAWRMVGDAEECRARLGSREVLLVRPMTYMNRSGVAATASAARHGIDPSEFLVVADDIYLPWGRLRIREGGGAGGHKGLLSLQSEFGTEALPRLRIGVGSPPEGIPAADFVLEPLEGAIRDDFVGMVARAAGAVTEICAEGIAAAMNRFNPPPPPAEPERRDRPEPDAPS